ncbi:hypothetical protein QJQ45_029465, partial [Haematococcus lacustris]
PPASPHCGSIEGPSQDGLLSPESSIMSFEFDAPARMMQSTARLTTGAAPSLQHKGISDTISSQAKRTPSQKPHAGNSMSEQNLTHQRHAHRQPTSHTPSLMGRHLVDQQLEQLGRVASSTSQETQSRGGQRATNPPAALASSTHREAAGSGRTAGNAPAAHVGVVTSSSQPAEQPPRRSLAELETMLSRAMNQISMERDPASRQGDDGPFDISELWAAGGTALSQGSHSESYQESHLDTVGTAESRRTRDMDEVLSGRVGTVGGPAHYPALHPVNAWRQASPQQQQPYSKQHASRASPPPASQRQAKPSAKQAGRKPDPAVAVTTHERSNVVAGSHASAAAAARPQSAVAARGEPPHMVSRTASPHWQRPPSPSPAPNPAAAAAAPRQYAGAGRARPLSAPRMHSHRQAVPAGQASPRAASRPQQATAAETAQRQGPPVGTECTFQPRINPASRDMVAVSYPADWEQRVLQLSVPKPVLMARYEEVRKEAREEELRECTFAPRTGRAPSPAVVQRSGPVHERLYNTRPAWEEKRGELLREREEAVLADCTFKPAVTSVAKRRAASAGRVPLHLRVADVLRSKNENMSNARIRREMADEGITFRPAVNPRSAQMVAAKQADAGCSQQGMPAGDRLYHEALHRSRAKDTERRGSDQACTFAPTINDRSRTLLARSGELPSSFLERQQFLASLAAEKKALYKSVVQEAEGTYTPRLAGGQPGAGPDGLRSSGYCTPKALGSSWASEDLDDTRDRLAKLAYADVRRSVALKDALTQHYYGQFPFTPDINPTSRVIGKLTLLFPHPMLLLLLHPTLLLLLLLLLLYPMLLLLLLLLVLQRHTMEELYRDESARAARERAAEELAARQQEECTFQPALNPRSLQVAQHAAVRRSRGGSGSLLDGVNSQKLTQAKATKLQDARALKEQEELRECTFTPEVNRQSPQDAQQAAAAASVPGMARYLELQSLAKRKKEEEAKRQQEVVLSSAASVPGRQVWWQNPKGPTAQFTVPQPFSIEQRQAELRQAQAADAKAAATAPRQPAAKQLPAGTPRGVAAKSKPDQVRADSRRRASAQGSASIDRILQLAEAQEHLLLLQLQEQEQYVQHTTLTVPAQ